MFPHRPLADRSVNSTAPATPTGSDRKPANARAGRRNRHRVPRTRDHFSQSLDLKSRLQPGVVTLPSEHVNCAKTIFHILTRLPIAANRIPRFRKLHQADSAAGPSRYVLKPCLAVSAVSRHVRHDLCPFVLEQPPWVFAALRATLQRDIRQLYESHVAFSPDLKTLPFLMLPQSRQESRARKQSLLSPIIDAFDMTKHPRDPAVPWDRLRERRRRHVHAQLNVLELLVCLLHSSPPTAFVVSYLPPDTTIDMLEHCSADSQYASSVIRYITEYSSRLGRYTHRYAVQRLLNLVSRKGPPSSNPPNYPPHWTDERNWAYWKAVRDATMIQHVVQLLEERRKQTLQEEPSILFERATLLIFATCYHMYAHATTINSPRLIGILDLYSDDHPECYYTEEGFRLVANSRAAAREAYEKLGERRAELHFSTLQRLKH